jgi:hypothetical protein
MKTEKKSEKTKGSFGELTIQTIVLEKQQRINIERNRQ